MKALAQNGLKEEQQLFVDGQSLNDLEIGIEFWLAVEECEFCDTCLCSIHYQRMYDTL